MLILNECIIDYEWCKECTGCTNMFFFFFHINVVTNLGRNTGPKVSQSNSVVYKCYVGGTFRSFCKVYNAFF